MKDEFVVCKVSKDDMTAPLFQQIVHVENSGGDPYSVEQLKELWCEDNHFDCFVCTNHHKAIGHIIFNPHSRRRNGSVYVINLVVLPEYRGQGIGQRLLEAGFDKDISIKLINSTLIANLEEDMYATLDVAILDLYKGNLEFIKNGACPTFIKRGKEIQILKSLELPTGIVENMDLVVYDYDLQPDDLIVMCTDGVIESNTEYISKELWIKYLLEDIQTTDAQKIADIILSEAIDNNYGKQKDDMTVIVAKIGRF